MFVSAQYWRELSFSWISVMSALITAGSDITHIAFAVVLLLHNIIEMCNMQKSYQVLQSQYDLSYTEAHNVEAVVL